MNFHDMAQHCAYEKDHLLGFFGSKGTAELCEQSWKFTVLRSPDSPEQTLPSIPLQETETHSEHVEAPVGIHA